MARNRKPLVGDADIRKAIRQLDGVLGSANDRVQEIAVAIIEHAANKGNGDVSQALNLCKVVKKHRTMNVNFLVGFFRHFGNCNVNLRANDGQGKVSLIGKDAKGYRGFDPAGAKAVRWDEAVDDSGNRAPWYQGPMPETYEPDTVGDVADDFRRFIEREQKKLTGTKTVGGKEVPLVNLSEDDRNQVDNALSLLARIADTLSRHEDIQVLETELAKRTAEAGQDEQVVAILQPDKAVA